VFEKSREVFLRFVSKKFFVKLSNLFQSGELDASLISCHSFV
jgi:hypothetical protein